MILYIKIQDYGSYSYKSIDLLKYKVEEITSNNITLEIKEPKVFYYYDFNEYNSFGMYSNKTFLLIEQKIEYPY